MTFRRHYVGVLRCLLTLGLGIFALVVCANERPTDPQQITIVAQVDVDQDTRSDTSADTDQNTTDTEESADTSDDSYAFLFERIQNRLRSMESVLSELQGRIEKLEFELQETQHNQQRRIANMEQRIHQALSGAPTSGSSPIGTDVPVDIVAVTTPGSDESFYAEGMNSLRNHDYRAAEQYFDQLLQQFPNSKYAPDSMFWLGEINASFEPTNLERARQQFVQLIRLFPNHDQVPNALFKLGTVYHQLGDTSRAMEYLERVVAEYPDHDVAELASQYASELK